MKVYNELFDLEISTNAVLLLSYLIDVEPILKKKTKDGYYRIANSFINERLDWSSHIIRTTFAELEDNNLIYLAEHYEKASKQSNVKTKARYFKFNEELIMEIIIGSYESDYEEYTPTPKIVVDNLKNLGRQPQKIELTAPEKEVDNLVNDHINDHIKDLVNDHINDHIKNFNIKQNNIITNKTEEQSISYKTFSKSYEPDGSSNTNMGEVLNFSEFNSNINKRVKNLTKEDSYLENEKLNIYVDKGGVPGEEDIDMAKLKTGYKTTSCGERIFVDLDLYEQNCKEYEKVNPNRETWNWFENDSIIKQSETSYRQTA